MASRPPELGQGGAGPVRAVFHSAVEHVRENRAGKAAHVVPAKPVIPRPRDPGPRHRRRNSGLRCATGPIELDEPTAQHVRVDGEQIGNQRNTTGFSDEQDDLSRRASARNRAFGDTPAEMARNHGSSPSTSAAGQVSEDPAPHPRGRKHHACPRAFVRIEAADGHGVCNSASSAWTSTRRDPVGAIATREGRKPTLSAFDLSRSSPSDGCTKSARKCLAPSC
jgi:hypothetical protein